MRPVPDRLPQPSLRRRLLSVALVAAVLLATASAASASPGLRPPASQTKSPANFWRSARQAVAIADRSPEARTLHAREPGVRGRAYVGDLGLWIVVYRDRRGERARVPVEDRTGDVLEPSIQAYPLTSGDAGPATVKVELIALALTVFLLALLFDFRRPFRLRNLDLVALLSLGASVVLLDHGHPLTGIPLAYPPLLYLFLRLAKLGFRGTGDEGPLPARGGTRFLVISLLALVAVRVAANLLLGGVSDVGYASVFGANSIHDGWPLYVQDHNHLDTYGPITYLAYLPFEAIFPLHNLRHDYLPAAHAAALAFDLITIVGLLLLGRRLRGGEAGRRLGLVLAVAWAACPFTFLSLVANTNDGLVPMFVVGALVAISSPVRRGIVLGLGAAAKFAPLLLAGVFATACGDRGRRTLRFALAMAAAIAAPVLLYSRPGGLGVFWSQTLGFQLHRHSFLSIWGQYPQLNPVKIVLEAGTIALAAGAAVPSARRTTAQVGALAGAILIALELTATHWYFFYVGWFVPGVLLALLALDRRTLPLSVSSAGSAEALESSITLRLPEPALRQ